MTRDSPAPLLNKVSQRKELQKQTDSVIIFAQWVSNTHPKLDFRVVFDRK